MNTEIACGSKTITLTNRLRQIKVIMLPLDKNEDNLMYHLFFA